MLKYAITCFAFYALATCFTLQHQIAPAVVAWSLGTWPMIYVAGGK